VHQFVRSFFVALIAGLMVGPALGSDNPDVRNHSSCEAGRPVEQHAWLGAGQRHLSGLSHVRKIENIQSALNERGDGQFALDRPSTADASRDTGQPGKLALLENPALPSKGSSTAAAQPSQTWVRLSDTPNVPEPGSWAVLLAGFLGICAVARPRIFSS